MKCVGMTLNITYTIAVISDEKYDYWQGRLQKCYICPSNIILYWGNICMVIYTYILAVSPGFVRIFQEVIVFTHFLNYDFFHNMKCTWLNALFCKIFVFNHLFYSCIIKLAMDIRIFFKFFNLDIALYQCIAIVQR